MKDYTIEQALSELKIIRKGMRAGSDEALQAMGNILRKLDTNHSSKHTPDHTNEGEDPLWTKIHNITMGYCSENWGGVRCADEIFNLMKDQPYTHKDRLNSEIKHIGLSYCDYKALGYCVKDIRNLIKRVAKGEFGDIDYIQYM